MNQEQVKPIGITLYPSQLERVERYMRALKIRKFSQAIQRLIDDIPDAWLVNGAEKQDTNGGASAVGTSA